MKNQAGLLGSAIENTIQKQWIGVMVTSKPCSARRLANLRALVERNRFIAPIGRAPPGTFRFRRKRRRQAAQ